MKEAKKLRRSSAGGYARGDETRQRIIDAAAELFGAHGFEGASTRDIAARAGVNAPALQYYFENKEGVYRACIESIADKVWAGFAPAVDQARAVLDADAGADALIDAFVGIQEAIAYRMFSEPGTPNQRLFFAREQSGYEPESASEILFQRVRGPLNNVSCALIGRITGAAPDDTVTRIRMFSLHGQLAIFHVAHRSTLALLEWKAFDAEKAELLRTTIFAQTRTLLEQWHREREAKEARDTPRRAAAPRQVKAR
ncbi:CerR family C-terminal domain-containing protein [Burkholderia alba]|uniref:CerR family C-terminal domain-containing protein n=1 Tax=Burkholderia alba TaxID=2683677 RepID=UPI002B057494|nr:CerR family C-terminal domain-containing protein [Burkholderia alba]